MALSTIGLGLYTTLGPSSSTAEIVGFEFLGGLGAGCVFTTVMIAIQSRASQDNTATATSTLGFVRNIACSISVIVGGAVLSNGMQSQRGSLALAGLNETSLALFASEQSAANVLRVSSITDLNERYAVQRAYSNSLREAWILYASVSGVGFISSLFIKKAILSRDHVETKTGVH